ncbi:DEAD/DEAH box helicase [Synoicihabitans lomoniglobus]|uniref:DEAD/DEAH box helicase n=1 Tax=Synoicihabitans lomoniglobus TaxID=2909285 RepID=A0AAE9ZZQ4_9BACT|nr:DEAD/DEAH box helicase [Opitutaceae bacterium LMO-M01]WED64438.1 DEAD/DEAH box helicase [Opitutaceae bacterium LMO-M01]
MPGSKSILRSETALGALILHLERDYGFNTRKRGRTYFRNGAVHHIWEDHEILTGSVTGSHGELYTTTLHLADDKWHADCTCPVGENCKHAQALGLQWLEQDIEIQAERMYPTKPPVAPAPVKKRKNSFREHWSPLLAAKIGRDLTRDENHLLSQLSALFHDYQNLGRLTRFALNEHGFAATSIPYDYNAWKPAFTGWWSDENPPADPWELWQYIALHWEREGQPIPEAFSGMTDTTAVRVRIDEVLQREELEQWRRSFTSRAIAQSETPKTSPLRDTYSDLRIRLNASGEAFLEGAPPDAKAWRAPTQKWLKHLATTRLDEIEAYPEPARSVALTFRFNAHYDRIDLGRGGQLSVGQLSTILQHPHAVAAVRLPDDSPYQVQPDPVELHGQPDPKDPSRLLFTRQLPNGRVIPTDAAPFVHAPDPLYLIDNRVWLGPERLPSSRLPISALSDPGISGQLKQLGLRLPSSFEAKFVDVELRPFLRCWLSETDAHHAYSSTTFHVQLFAQSDDPPCAQHWAGFEGWNWTADDRPPTPAADTPHYRFDLSRANAVSACFGEFKLVYASQFSSWIRNVTADFPQQFTMWRASLPADLVIEASPELQGLLGDPLRARVTASVSPSKGSGQDWFDVSLKLQPEDVTLTDEELRLLVAARGKWVRLPQRGWQRLSYDPTDKGDLDPAVERLGLTPDPSDLLTSRARPETHRYHALQLAGIPLDDKALATRLRQRVKKLQAVVAPPVPADLTAHLRPYQKEGYHYLVHLATQGLGGILADDMGLGKTVQTLAWLLWLRDRRPTGSPPFRVLIVCPKSVAPNWQNETARFTPTLTATRPVPRQPLPTDANLLVINYTQLRLRADDLTPIEWDAVILDEGQNIKTPTSTTARTARELRARHRLVLSGTPIENRLLDLWSLLAFAQPGLLGTQASFQRLYREKEDPAGARSRLATRVRPFMLRRTKSEVARDLPARTEEDISCELEGPQRKLYDAELKRARQLLLKVKTARQFDAERFNILQSLLRLRQICCDPRLVSTDTAASASVRKTTATSSAKLEALVDTLEPLVAEGHRVLVFSQFVTMLELIREALVARRIGHLLLTGQTENRQELVDTFQATDGPPVFLLSLKAAGAGLNLTAASYVVLYDPWWNPAVEAQAIDRTHRIGQTNNVIAYRLIAKDTIEEKIRALQHDKAALAAAVVQEDSLAKVMDLDSLRDVLS